MEKQVKFDVTVSVIGVKKRCRKTDRHSLSLGYIDYTENLSGEQVSELMDRAKGIIETNMKRADRAQLNLMRTELDGVFRTVIIFDKRNLTFPINL